MKLLLITVNKKLSDILSRNLEKEGYVVDNIMDGELGLEMVLLGSYDLVILDWLLPEIDGITIVKELRQQGIEIPILFLSANDRIEDKVAGLDAGADDYLVKSYFLLRNFWQD